MRRLLFIVIILSLAVGARGQISVTADSVNVYKWDLSKEAEVPVSRNKEDISLMIDKDLMTLKITGITIEKSYIERAYLIELLELNSNMDKWLFQGVDKECLSYTITLDANARKLRIETFGKEVGIPKPLNTICYTITDIKINKEAIQKHIKEKGIRIPGY
ncbi:MAG: hypothetical protein Q8868_00750 [Bacteroidota bacterium]|nr:hypothetical protein [Bacteroidota bacterium]